MNKNQNSLFLYLEKEGITIDKAEFEFQLKAHPDYGSLLAISDTLSFMNIENGAIRVIVSEIELLPNRFITFLSKENAKPELCFIEKKENTYFYSKDSKYIEITKSELEKKWQEIVLLVAKPEYEVNVSNNKNAWVLPLLLSIVVLIVLIQGQATEESKFFIFFPIIGLLFSIIALEGLFGTKSEILTNFCNISSSTSCSTVVNSDKWKIFKHINFSDLSIIFFATQFLGIFIFLISGDVSSFLHIQEILLLCSIPVVLASLYFQKIVEKKWCPICLVIIGLLLFETIYLFQIISFSIDIPFKSITLFVLVFLLVSFVWTILKGILTEQKELKEFRFKGHRFMRNYEIFKNLLLSENKIKLSHSPIVLGNKASKIEISFITNPFCGHCKNAHKILDKILSQNRNNLKIKVLINADFENMDEDKKNLFRSLMSIYLEKGEDSFLEALKNWFDKPNIKDWMDVYQSNSNHEEIDSFYQLQNQWCIDNNSFQTPSIFINGYRYPKNYERESLEFFVNELVEDEI